jgi:putative molybdopterin biosynthesis protein
MSSLMTTREVADYLRIKERRVYDLVRDGRIPCARITGKLLFPKDLVDGWIAQETEGPAAATRPPPPPIVAGSQDPLLEWALRESGSGLAMLVCGSAGGLERLAARGAVCAGIHLLDVETGDYNIPFARRMLSARDTVLIGWAWRSQGLVVAPGNPFRIKSLRDVIDGGHRVVCRQEGSGSRLLFEALMAREGAGRDGLNLVPEVPKGETELGFAVLDGRADAGIAVEAAARQLGLDFIPLATERFDLAIDRHGYFEPPMQALLKFTASGAFRLQAAAFGGYDLAPLGTVAWNGG